MKKLATILFTIILLATSQTLMAQIPLEVNTTVVLPFPKQYSFWSTQEDAFHVMVTNSSDTKFEYYVSISIESTDGQTYVRFRDDFRPTEGFTAFPNNTSLVTSDAIIQTYGNVSLSSIDVSDNVILEFNGELPAGEYVICSQLLQFNDNPADPDVFLSPVSCSDPFDINSGNIELLDPMDDITLPLDIPANFSWVNNSLTIDPSLEYILKLYEMEPIAANEESIYDLVLSGDIPTMYISEPTLGNLIIYDEVTGVPWFKEGYLYAAQVELASTADVFFENDGKSNITSFWYGHNPNDDIPTNEVSEQQYDCYENCNYTLDNNATLSTTPEPETIDVGHFKMEDITYTSAENGVYTGTGRINVEWFNHIYIKVSFNGIKVNSDGRMIDGMVYADKAPDMPTMPSEANSFIKDAMLAAATLGADATIDLPFGVYHNIGGSNLLLGITDLEFSPTTADANTACNFHIPAFGPDNWISMETTKTCMHPGGFGNEFVMHMGYDQTIMGQGDVTIKIKGSDDDDVDEVKDESTYIEVDCNGIKSISLKADIFFPERMFVKENIVDGCIIHSTESDAENRVKANLNFTIDRESGEDGNVYAEYNEDDFPEETGFHFIAKASMEDAFQIKGVEGWGFDVTDIWIDASDFSNPEDIVFPASYTYDWPIIDNTWTGFYMKELEMRTPKEFVKGNQRQGFSVYDMIIDTDITMSVSVNGILGRNAGQNLGEIDGWSFTIDHLYMDIVQGRFEAAGLKGEVGLPITEEGKYIAYDAYITDSDTDNTWVDQLEYVFTMSPVDDFKAPILLSEVVLDKASYVKMGYNPSQEQSAYMELYAAGRMTIKSDAFEEEESEEKPMPFDVPLLEFDFKYHSTDGITDHNFGILGNDIVFQDSEEESPTDSPGGDATGSNEYRYNNFPFKLKEEWINNISTNGGNDPEFNKEKFVGFPITIEDMSLTNSASIPGGLDLMIQPEITLIPGSSNVTASTVIHIISKSNTTENDGKRLIFEKLTVTAIELVEGTEIGGIQVSGLLDFYNEIDNNNVANKGVKGNLSVMLPMGLGVRMAAEFGTEVVDKEAEWDTDDNFPYFYVDGMVYFGDKSGIPIGGAVAIYGVGGGLSYNMTRSAYEGDADAITEQLETMNSGPEVDMDNMKDEDIRRTGVAPQPAFGTHGLKLAATLGTFPISSLLNADIAIEAEYTKDHGISLVRINGDGYLMTPIGERDDPPVQIGVSITYEAPAPDVYTLDSELQVWVNIKDVFIGSGPDELAGTASMHIHSDRGNTGWHFFVGHSNPDVMDRVGFLITLPTKNKNNGSTSKKGVAVNGYFMLGEGLPTELPVPAFVEELFGNSNSSGDNSLTSATIGGSEYRGDDDIQDANDGTGFALGSEVSIDIDVDQFGVYATLYAVLGFDINVTQSLSRTCYIPSEGGEFVPGSNGWYATGQIYAGLEGSLGFRVRAFGKDNDLELFNMAAAMMLSGGGPNPVWAEGRAALKISVFGGLITCSKSITIRAGDQCVPHYDDPFGGVPLIAEYWPEDGSKKQSTWSEPEVSFTFPMNELLIIPVVDDEGNSSNDYLVPKIENIVFKEFESGKDVILDDIIWSDENRHMKFDVYGNLEGKTKYEVSMRLYAMEYLNKAHFNSNVDGFRTIIDGEEWYQDTTFTFRTGKLSGLDEIITTSIPIRNQRYFVQNDIPVINGNRKSYVQLSNEALHDTYFMEEDEDKTYEYFVRYSPIDGGTPIETSLDAYVLSDMVVDSIYHNIPQLVNNTTYVVQFIQKYELKNQDETVMKEILGPLKFKLNASSSDYELNSTTSVNFTNKKINPADKLTKKEWALYSYYFKTSKFNTYEEKFANITPSYQAFPIQEIQFNIAEPLDVFDVFGEFVEIDNVEYKVMDALVQIYDPIDFEYEKTNIGTYVPIVNVTSDSDYTRYYDKVIKSSFVEFANYIEENGPLHVLPWPDDDLRWDYYNDIELKLTEKVLNYDGALTMTDIDDIWMNTNDSGITSMINTSNLSSVFNSAIANTNGVDNKNIKIHYKIGTRVNHDRDVLLDWAAELKAIDKDLETTVDNFNDIDIADNLNEDGSNSDVNSEPADVVNDDVTVYDETIYDYGDIIDTDFPEFNVFVDQLVTLNAYPSSHTGKFKLNLYKDSNWDPNSKGVIFETKFYKTASSNIQFEAPVLHLQNDSDYKID